MTWRLANSLERLRTQVNQTWPDRPTQSDGTIGDAAHAARQSDHNPNAAGVVCAWDITAAPFSNSLADALRVMGERGDGRVAYVIWNRRITSAAHDWQWVNYNGADPHTSHIHLSVSQNPHQYDRTDRWAIPGAAPVWWHRLLKVTSPMLRGSDVTHVQIRLRIHQDGLYGPETAKAVKAFQDHHNIAADGIVGPETAKTLG